LSNREVFDLRFGDLGPISLAADEWKLFRGAGERAGKLFLHSVLDFYKLDLTRYFEHASGECQCPLEV
jgi:hypothetical protein